MKIFDLSGIWECSLPGLQGQAALPGTLDEAGIGFPDDPGKQWKAEEVRRLGFWQEGDPIVTRLTRKKTWEGPARFRRTVRWNPPAGKQVYLECERSRHLRVEINGQEAPAAEAVTLSAPCVFDVTGLVTGQDEIVLTVDNSYPGWPRNAIVYSSAASDETQTNWNGVLGYLRFRMEEPDRIDAVRVYPEDGRAEIRAELRLSRVLKDSLRISSPALAQDAEIPLPEKNGVFEVRCTLPLHPEVRRWDLGEGHLYPLTVRAGELEEKTVTFGVRCFAPKEGRLTLNGRRFFLRGEANCAVFPETGYIPMDTEAWTGILEKYRSYGVNCMRFHSHCPPEAAFTAADRMGMLMQPELSHWDPEDAFAAEEARTYYAAEARQILRSLANHPSFVMLSFGNELHFREEFRPFTEGLLRELRETDATRLYAAGSNAFYGTRGPNPADDFYTSSDDRGQMLRAASAEFAGWLNREDTQAVQDYSAQGARLRAETSQPVFSFEVGQYEVLPDFREIREYRGVTDPCNLRQMEKKMREAGLEAAWPEMIRATGENALQCYRAEVEAVMRTEEFSGISLLGLQDFPGQGTALVGMMNAHLQPKPYPFADPQRFAAFFRDVLPLSLLSRSVFTAGEAIRLPVRIANYGKEDLEGSCCWSLTGEDGGFSGESAPFRTAAGSLSETKEFTFHLPTGTMARQWTLTLRYCGSVNTYPLWVYPEVQPECPGNVLECRVLDETAWQVLSGGGRVFLSPDSTAEALPRSVQAQFSPDFWSVCTFPSQSGCMGQWIDAKHPLFRGFPTDTFSSWQWKPMACRRAMLLPRRMKTIVAEMDSCMLLRPMAQLFECRCGGGRLIVSSLDLHRLEPAPNVRALQKAIYDYMASDDFLPEEELSPDTAAEFLPCR